MAEQATVWVRIGSSWHKGTRVGVQGDRVRVAVPGLARPQLFVQADVRTEKPAGGDDRG